MSEFENVTTLEDLFRSRAFDQSHRPRRVAAPSRAQVGPTSLLEDVLLGRGADLSGAQTPLLPLAERQSPPVVRGPARHDTTTHARRNRMVATVSGIAAAVLLAIGVITSPRAGRSAPGVQASPPTTLPSTQSGHDDTGGGNGSGSSRGNTNAPKPGSTSSGGASTPTSAGSGAIELASATVSTGQGEGTTPTSSGSMPPPGAPGSSEPTGGQPGTPAPAPAGTVLSPVVHLVGQVVKVTGTTVSGVSTGLSQTVPPLSPVTNLTGGLGSTLTGLGESLIATV